jgi:hypothetical protein
MIVGISRLPSERVRFLFKVQSIVILVSRCFRAASAAAVSFGFPYIVFLFIFVKEVFRFDKIRVACILFMLDQSVWVV